MSYTNTTIRTNLQNVHFAILLYIANNLQQMNDTLIFFK